MLFTWSCVRLEDVLPHGWTLKNFGVGREGLWSDITDPYFVMVDITCREAEIRTAAFNGGGFVLQVRAEKVVSPRFSEAAPERKYVSNFMGDLDVAFEPFHLPTDGIIRMMAVTRGEPTVKHTGSLEGMHILRERVAWKPRESMGRPA